MWQDIDRRIFKEQKVILAHGFRDPSVQHGREGIALEATLSLVSGAWAWIFTFLFNLTENGRKRVGCSSVCCEYMWMYVVPIG